MRRKNKRLLSAVESAKEADTPKRIRRNEETLIADLEKRIAQLRQRHAAKEAMAKVKKLPHVAAAIEAMQELQRAATLSSEHSDGDLTHALADAQAALLPYFTHHDLPIAEITRPRGRRRQLVPS
jgi:phosphopantetheinyl transferase (holo-ACP synthase)